MKFIPPSVHSLAVSLSALVAALTLNACGGGAGNNQAPSNGAVSSMAIAVEATESSSSSSANGTSSSAAAEPGSSSSSSSSSVNQDTTNIDITLASCFNPAPGKQFTAETHQETSYSKPSTTYSTNSIATGTYLGKDAILESSTSSLYSNTYYSIYSSTSIEVLAEISQSSYGLTPSTTTSTFSGFVIDLTKKIGETQTINLVQTYSSGSISKTTVNLTWIGNEAISIAGTQITACKLTLIPPLKNHTAISYVMWAAPGYGFNSGIRVDNEIQFQLTGDYSHSTTVQTSPL